MISSCSEIELVYTCDCFSCTTNISQVCANYYTRLTLALEEALLLRAASIGWIPSCWNSIFSTRNAARCACAREAETRFLHLLSGRGSCSKKIFLIFLKEHNLKQKSFLVKQSSLPLQLHYKDSEKMFVLQTNCLWYRKEGQKPPRLSSGLTDSMACLCFHSTVCMWAFRTLPLTKWAGKEKKSKSSAAPNGVFHLWRDNEC